MSTQALVTSGSGGPKTISLFDAEEHLLALLDTEALVEPEQRAAFQEELQRGLSTRKDKCDSVRKFLVYCKAQERMIDDLIREEIEHLQESKAVYTKARERLEGYTLYAIQRLHEPDADGKYPKLTGNHSVLAARRNPESVAILDEAAVPDDYKTVTITLPAAVVQQIGTELAFAESEHLDAWTDARGSVSVSKTAVKKALASGPVAGAEMRLGAYRLEVK